MKAKKSLGQNFFVNENLGNYILDRIVKEDVDTVVEIGPGLGFFTKKLTERFRNVIVIEKDHELAQNLRIQFPQITVLNEDFLDLDLKKVIKGDVIYFGSLPYNISKPIIRKIVADSTFLHGAYFIVQKEVAEKYIYRKPYNILSLTTYIYANVKKEFDISPDSFRPKPKVTSSFISLKHKQVPDIHIIKLEELIKNSFKQPRKNLRNNLKNTEYINKIDKYADKRPADLSLEEYISILQ
jgi:16S rRNA (adenine1518-N6/adenine1519-N6)-dimethyltransferase